MDTFERTPIAHNFCIEVVATERSYPPHIESQVEQIWIEEKLCRGDHLYNGHLLSLISIAQGRLVGEAADYKHFLAQYVNPALSKDIKITPVAVTGIVHAGGKYLVGERATTVLNHHGLLEFVPSGGVEQGIDEPGIISPSQQLLLELYEETGIDASFVVDVVPFIVIKEGEWGPVDICAKIELSPAALAHSAFPSDEHTVFFWKTKEELFDDLTYNPSRYAPLTVELIRSLN